MEQKIKPASIKEIREILDNTAIGELASAMEPFRTDERAGVVKLLETGDRKLVRYQQELDRLHNMRAYERKYSSYQAICGVDEAGRGPLAGPVCAAAVILPKDLELPGLTDSKKLTEIGRAHV